MSNPGKKNLTGQKFGRLLVIEEAGQKVFPSGQKRTLWKCKCDCGNYVVVDQANLLRGHTQSCGCIVHEQGKKLRKDLTGQGFGRLTVVEFAGMRKTPNGSRKSMWRCRCDCGNEVIVQNDGLRAGQTQSCGCYKLDRSTELLSKPIDGQRFGMLTAIKRVGNDRFNQSRYLCKCDCGGTAIVHRNNLVRGLTSSCGCIKSKGEAKINKWLTEHNVNFVAQYSLDDIKLSSGRRPFFDFGVFDNAGKLLFLLEYNGIQHYQPTFGWNDKKKFEYNLKHDQEKREQCAERGYDLAIIPYTMIDNIDLAMSNLMKIYNLNSVQQGGT